MSIDLSKYNEIKELCIVKEKLLHISNIFLLNIVSEIAYGQTTFHNSKPIYFVSPVRKLKIEFPLIMLNIFHFYAIHIEEVRSIIVSDYRPPELNSIWFLGIAVWKFVSTFVGHLTNKAATPALINLYNLSIFSPKCI